MLAIDTLKNRSVSWLSRILDRLTRPSTSITSNEARQQARLLSSIILTSLIVLFVLIIKPNYHTQSTASSDRLVLAGTGVLMVALYIASRTRYYLQTAVATIGALLVAVLLIFSESAYGVDYAYLSVVILLASVLFRLRLLLLTILVALVATLALVSDHPDFNLNSEPFMFVLVASAGIVFVSIYRREQERSRMGVLIDREARLRLILEQMPAILWTTDENLIITSATGSGFQHIPADADEMVGSWIASAPPIEKVSMFRTDAHYDALMGQSGTYESQWGDVTFQCFIEPLYDAQDRIIGCVGVALDITERRSAEQVAVDFRTEKERVQVLSDFIQNATHDLSTPLSVINASIYLLRNSTEPEKQQRYINTLNTQTERLDNLVKSMLTMLRLDKTDAFSMEHIDLNQMMRNLPTRFQAEMQVKRLTLQQDFDTTLPAIQANESYLLQALHEVLDNAIQFTNVGGIITLRTRYENDRAIIEITDTGIGIAPEDQVRIFERFYQVDKSHATAHSGSGLGLAIVRRVIDGHNGRIHVHSVSGEGTTFRIALPIEVVPDGSPSPE